MGFFLYAIRDPQNSSRNETSQKHLRPEVFAMVRQLFNERPNIVPTHIE